MADGRIGSLPIDRLRGRRSSVGAVAKPQNALIGALHRYTTTPIVAIVVALSQKPLEVSRLRVCSVEPPLGTTRGLAVEPQHDLTLMLGGYFKGVSVWNVGLPSDQ